MVDCEGAALQTDERAGNSIEVLMTRYVRCLHGRQALANRRVDAFLDECN
ncbi:hypothetical protein [Streptomyces sp. NPDC058874]